MLLSKNTQKIPLFTKILKTYYFGPARVGLGGEPGPGGSKSPLALLCARPSLCLCVLCQLVCPRYPDFDNNWEKSNGVANTLRSMFPHDNSVH